MLCFVSLCYTLATATEAQAIQYSITDLGEYSATQLNNHGQVVGSLGAGDPRDYYLWENGVWTDLHLSTASFADKLTDGGKILFNGLLAFPTVTTVWDTSTGTSSGFPIVNLSKIREIDDAGNAVGSTKQADEYHGIIYWNGVLQDLGPKAGANGFNPAGQVVGYTEAESGEIHATLFENGSASDLGVLDGQSQSSAGDINENGVIIGVSRDPGWRAFAYRDGQMQDLGDLGGGEASPTDINNHNQIVGTSLIANDGDKERIEYNRAFLHQDGLMVDLNSLIDPALGWELRIAYAINDGGLILGSGQLNGERRSFLLTPVPEPSTYALGVLALWGLVALPRMIRVRPCR